MTRQVPPGWPTRRQVTVLRTIRHTAMRADQIAVRSDVLWRMEEVGWVARNLHEVWHILPAGLAIVREWEDAHLPPPSAG
jgi:hypothetical protein